MDKYYIYLFGSLLGTYVLLLVTAAVIDVTKFIIPNVIVVALVALFFIATILSPLDTNWISHIGAAASVFLVGVVAYRFKKLGAGDVKLMTAVSLWMGFEYLPLLLLYVALCGGAVAFFFIGLRHLALAIAIRWPRLGTGVVPRLLVVGEKIPYGVAIAIGSVIIGRSVPHLGPYL